MLKGIFHWLFCTAFLSTFTKSVQLHPGRILTIVQGYNEREAVTAFMDHLDTVDKNLDDLQTRLNGAQATTYKRIDDLISKMSSRKSLDALQSFAKKKSMEDKMKNTIKSEIDNKVNRYKEIDSLKTKLSELSNPSTEERKLKNNNQLTLGKKEDYENLIRKLQEMQNSGKQITIALPEDIAGNNTPGKNKEQEENEKGILSEKYGHTSYTDNEDSYNQTNGADNAHEFKEDKKIL